MGKHRSRSEQFEEKIRRAKFLRELEEDGRGLRSRSNFGKELADLTVNVQKFLDPDDGATFCDRFTLIFDLCGNFLIRSKYSPSLARVPMLRLTLPTPIMDDFVEQYVAYGIKPFRKDLKTKSAISFLREKDIYFLCRVMHGRTTVHQDSVLSMLTLMHKKYFSQANWDLQLGLQNSEDILNAVEGARSAKDLLLARRRHRPRGGVRQALDEATAND